MNINRLNEELNNMLDDIEINVDDVNDSIKSNLDPEIMEQQRIKNNQKEWEQVCNSYKDLGTIHNNIIEVMLTNSKWLKIERQTETYGYFDEYKISSVDYITNKIEYSTSVYPTDLIKLAKYISNHANIDSYRVFIYLQKGLKCRITKHN